MSKQHIKESPRSKKSEESDCISVDLDRLKGVKDLLCLQLYSVVFLCSQCGVRSLTVIQNNLLPKTLHIHSTQDFSVTLLCIMTPLGLLKCPFAKSFRSFSLHPILRGLSGIMCAPPASISQFGVWSQSVDTLALAHDRAFITTVVK